MLNFYFSDCIIITENFYSYFLKWRFSFMYLAFYIFICLVIVFINLKFGNVELTLVICLSNYFLTNTYYMYM